MRQAVLVASIVMGTAFAVLWPIASVREVSRAAHAVAEIRQP